MKKIVILLLCALSLFGCSSDSLDSSRELHENRIIGVQLTPPLPAVGETLQLSLAVYTDSSVGDDMKISWNINNLSTVGETRLALDLSADALSELLTAEQKKELDKSGEVRLLITAELVEDIYQSDTSGKVINRIEIPFTLTTKVVADREYNPTISEVDCDGFSPDNSSGETTHYSIPGDSEKVEFAVTLDIPEDDSDSRTLFLDWNVGWDGAKETFPRFELTGNKLILYPPEDSSRFNVGEVTLFCLIRTAPSYSQPILFEFEEIHISFK